MTQTPTWLRTAHRVHTGLTIAVVVALVILNLTGVLSSGAALRLFLAIEVPLLLVFVVITVLRFTHFRPTTDVDRIGFLDRLETEEPLLRPVVLELRAFQSLFYAMGKKHQVPPGAVPVGYTKGTMMFPAVMAVLGVVELVIVHILVPWQWLQIVLLIVTIWGVLFMLGFFATRIVHPHFVTTDELHLRWGHKTVLATPRSNVLTATLHTNHVHTQPYAEGERLVLTQFQSTNVMLRFVEPVAAAAPVSKKQLPEGFHASEVLLRVDDPEAFLQALAPLSEELRP